MCITKKLFIGFLILLLTSCSVKQSCDKKSLSIVCTSFPAYDFARNLTGGIADTMLLLPPGSDSHSYDPKPSDLVAIENADIFIYNGGESDTWTKQLLSSTKKPKYTVSLCDSVDTLSQDTADTLEEHKHSKSTEHHHTFPDEHVWTSPVNTIKICKEITDRLIQADSRNTSYYLERLKEYVNELQQIDEALRNISAAAKKRILIFGDRFPFRYLAREYNFDYIAAFPGCTQLSEPAAKTVAELIDKVKETDSKVVFYVEFSNRKICDTISEDTGAEALLLHSCHNVTKKEFKEGIGYIELMKQNIEALSRALL